MGEAPDLRSSRSVSSPSAAGRSITAKERLILATLARLGETRPTLVGQACGKSYGAASSWACQSLKRLVKRGLALRHERQGIVTYSATVFPADLLDRSEPASHPNDEGAGT